MKKIILILVFIIASCGQNGESKKNNITPKDKIKNSIGMELVYIKPGTYTMGPDYKLSYAGRENEHPHKVTLTKGFYIQTTETTVGQWRQFINETRYKTCAEQVGFGWFQSESFTFRKPDPPEYTVNKFWNHIDNDKYPVTMVTWTDCQVFLKWLSSKEKEEYRLPTEAEWEYACRANENTHFPGGNLTEKWQTCKCDTQNQALNEVAWYNMNSDRTQHPVGLKKPNRWGLYDMVGNVREFCKDTYTKRFPINHVTDPVHLVNKGFLNSGSINKVIKGGSFHDPEFFVTSSTRDGSLIYNCDNTIGFRVVKSISKNNKRILK